MAEKYDLYRVPDEDERGYAERVRLRARMVSIATLAHWMSIDMAALDSIEEEARRIKSRLDCTQAARSLIDKLSETGQSAPRVAPRAPEREEEERARVRMTSIGVEAPDEMTYAEYAQLIDGQGFDGFGREDGMIADAAV
jgi:hypothetical protein